ncbi:20491_t:CDS:2 [Dentiscutata erythropus]|uniref:20491_t:CDS:1 n=1 Tax=Dentiscutata erythropus TaxID=1348616 RepID=A0A9N9G8B0_9GLOM|nr:20491_t:CDS:2 [Dentiscutata erythropus]
MAYYNTDSIFISYKQVSNSRNVIDKGGAAMITLEKYKGIDVAVKHFNENIMNEIANELRILRSLQCENIIKFYGVTKTPSGSTCLIMEYAHNGNLFNYLNSNKLTADTKADMAIQISWGLRKYHENGIIHSDLKSNNILVNKYLVLKITDFGVSRTERELDVRGKTGGTVFYAAPERLSEDKELEKHYKDLPHLSDIYSYGLVVWEIATNGKSLYDRMEKDKVRELKNSEDSEHFQILFSNTDVSSSSKLRKIIEGCCKKSPLKRMPLEKVEFKLLEDFPFVEKKNHASKLISEGNYKEAIQILEDELSIRDKNDTMAAMVLLQRGYTYFKTCQYQDTLNTITLSLKIWENNPLALMQLGSAYCLIGQYHEAFVNINAAHGIDQNLRATAIRGFINCYNAFAYLARGYVNSKKNRGLKSAEDFAKYHRILENNPNLAFWTIYKTMRTPEIDTLISQPVKQYPNGMPVNQQSQFVDQQKPEKNYPNGMPINQQLQLFTQQQPAIQYLKDMFVAQQPTIQYLKGMFVTQPQYQNGMHVTQQPQLAAQQQPVTQYPNEMPIAQQPQFVDQQQPLTQYPNGMPVTQQPQLAAQQQPVTQYSNGMPFTQQPPVTQDPNGMFVIQQPQLAVPQQPVTQYPNGMPD